MSALNVNIWGAGYIGMVNAVGLAMAGHKVSVVENQRSKIDLLKSGQIPHFEPQLQELFDKSKENLSFSQNCPPSSTSIHLVCVGTPIGLSGEVDLEGLIKCLKTILEVTAVDSTAEIIIRSTIPPGGIRNTIIPTLDECRGDKSFNIYHYPEFLREGSAVEDYYNPSLSIISTLEHGNRELISQLFNNVDFEWVDFEVSEMIKYMNNSFHALKVTFANEMATLAKKFSVDKQELFRLFLKDKKLNISESYLRPGPPYGGACLTKETLALETFSGNLGLDLPIVNNISKSNDAHMRRFFDFFSSHHFQKALIMGVTFKPDTDDERGSFVLEMLNQWKPSSNDQVIHVLDRSEVVNKISDKIPYPCFKTDEVDVDVNQYDLVFLGSKRLSESIRTALEGYQGLILNSWGWKLPSSITSKKNYYEF